jgi:glycosyltransferase involved in cell wall biosynthesis
MFDHVFVNSASNYNWILGHWVRQLKIRVPGKSLLWWPPMSYSRVNLQTKVINFLPLPKSKNYYFTFPSVFERHLQNARNNFQNNSTVLYTHRTPELGTIEHQVEILSLAHRIQFMCSRDMEILISKGLDSKKCSLIIGAVDDNCKVIPGITRLEKTVFLSSRYGPRKGLEHLPELLKVLPDWNFYVLGPDWKKFYKDNPGQSYPNLHIDRWTLEKRNLYVTKFKVFLSLSNLEGGPIPLLDALSCGMYGVATDTGFARDVIKPDINGSVVKLPVDIYEVRDAILSSNAKSIPIDENIYKYTWEFIAKDYLNNI